MMSSKKIVSIFCSVVMAMMFFVGAVPAQLIATTETMLSAEAASYASIAEGQYYLKNISTGTYLTVDGAKAANGQNVSVSSKSTSSAFCFGISGNSSSGYYINSQINTSYVVNPYSDTPANGTNVTLYKKTTDGTQNWHFEQVSGGYIIHNNYNKNLVLTVSGTNVNIATNSSSAAQTWVLEKVSTGYASITGGNYYLKNSSTGKYLSVDGAKAANGQNVSVTAKQTANAYQFNVSGSLANGYYLGSLLNTGYVINPYSDTPSNGTNITLYKKTADGTQNWHFEQVSGGYIIHNNYNKNLVLTANGTNAVLSTNTSATTQVWTLEKVDSDGDTDNNGYTAIVAGNYFMKNVSTGTYLTSAKAANGQNVSVAAKQDTDAFKTYISGSTSAGYLISSHLNKNYVVNPYSDTPGNGTNITLYKKSGDGTQNWYFEKVSTGYIIHNRYAPNCVLTVDGTNVVLKTKTGASNQIWVLETATESVPTPQKTVPTVVTDFTWKRDNWKFNNESKNFSTNYAMTESILNSLSKENGLNSYDKRKVKEYAEDKWCGSCYGFTMTELLAYNNDLDVSDYGGGNTVYASTVNSSTRSLINFYQISQRFSLNNQKFRRVAFQNASASEPAKIKAIIKHFQNGGGPFNLCYYLYASNGSDVQYAGGHSVVAYGVQDCSSENSGKGHYSATTGKYYIGKILIADCNFNTSNAAVSDACLYFDPTDYSWIIEYWNGTKTTIKKKTYTRYCYWNADSKVQFGQIGSLFDYTNASLNAEDDLEVNHYLAGIDLTSTSDYNYVLSEVVESGDMMYAAGDDTSIAPMNRMRETEYNSEVTSNEYALWNPTSSYSLTYEAPADYELEMDYENYAFFAEATNTTYTQFEPNGSYILEGESMTYDVSIVTEDAVRVCDWYSVAVAGSGANEVIYYATEDGFVLISDQMQNVQVSAMNDTVMPSVTFSTDYDEVLIYEIDVLTIGISVDTDGDGTYETPIAVKNTYALGDLNGDTKVDATDAAQILIASTAVGSGQTSVLIDAQEIAADVNKDGEFNATDAAVVLQYATYVGTGGTMTLEEFLAA